MKKVAILSASVLFLLIISCSQDNGNFQVEIPDFNYPQTVVFEQALSSYNIFEGPPSDLTPSSDFHLLELSSVLFTDYAKKQRLVKVPSGTRITKMSDGSLDFPDSTILVKTFFYYEDERDPSQGKRIIESRLLIKVDGIWNVATYVWNETQDDAILELNGLDTEVSWTDENGNLLTTMYHVPDENECITYHQSNETMIPLGTKLRNLNRSVLRNGSSLNQITYLQNSGVLNDFELNDIPSIIDYSDPTISLEERSRAYLDLNCAHCHNPFGWEPVVKQELDFRFETPLIQTGILDEQDEIEKLISEGEMPFIGTTLLDEEGINLLVEFIQSL